MKKLTATIEIEEQAGETYDNETYADLIKETIECNTTVFVHEVKVKSKKPMNVNKLKGANTNKCKWCQNGKHCSIHRCVCLAIEYSEREEICPDFTAKTK